MKNQKDSYILEEDITHINQIMIFDPNYIKKLPSIIPIINKVEFPLSLLVER